MKITKCKACKNLCILCFLLIAGAFQFSFSQTGSPDSSFNGNGILNGDIVNGFSLHTNTLALQNDKKIIMGAVAIDYLKLFRYQIDGSPDNSFGSNGAASINIWNQNLAISPQFVKLSPDGNINVLTSGYILCRFLPDGKIDTSLNHTGKIALNFDYDHQRFSDMLIQKDGKILLAGSTFNASNTDPDQKFLITRLNKNGSMDNSFGMGGIVSTRFNNYHENTAIDSMMGTVYSFGAGIAAMALTNDEKIVAAGWQNRSYYGRSDDSIAIAKYNSNGTLDISFNQTGKISINPPRPDFQTYGSWATSIVIQNDGKIIVGAEFKSNQGHGGWRNSDIALLRFKTNGSPDPSFDVDGIKKIDGLDVNSSCVKIALQSDDKIVIAGNTTSFITPRFVMVRINKDGSPDNNFGAGGIIIPLYTDEYNQTKSSTLSGMQLKDRRIYIPGSVSISGLFAFKNDGIDLHPAEIHLCASYADAIITADLSGAAYQWQVSTDSIHFSDISNNSNYNGVNTSSLTLTHLPASWPGYQYRCAVDNSFSNITSLNFLHTDENEWTGAVDNAWENAGNWLCGVVPGANSRVIINKGNVLIHSNITIGSLQLSTGTSVIVDPGFSVAINRAEL